MGYLLSFAKRNKRVCAGFDSSYGCRDVIVVRCCYCYRIYISTSDHLTIINKAVFRLKAHALAVTFTVPDRDNNGLSETIRYSWSGTPGDSIMRAYNGGVEVAVAEDVKYFSLEYLLKTIGGS